MKYIIMIYSVYENILKNIYYYMFVYYKYLKININTHIYILYYIILYYIPSNYYTFDD